MAMIGMSIWYVTWLPGRYLVRVTCRNLKNHRCLSLEQDTMGDGTAWIPEGRPALEDHHELPKLNTFCFSASSLVQSLSQKPTCHVFKGRF